VISSSASSARTLCGQAALHAAPPVAVPAHVKLQLRNVPSDATTDVGRPFSIADLSAAEIRERMSGNLCRCACYPNIVDAIAEAAARS